MWLAVDPLAELYSGISPYAYCNNNPVIYNDPDGKNIVLAGSGTQKLSLMENLQKLTNDKLKVDYHWSVYIAKKGGENSGRLLSSGSELISELINSSHTVTINIGKAGSGSTQGPRDTKNYTIKGKGSDSEVNFDITQKAKLLVENNEGSQSYQDTPLPIILGHELIHAERAMTGNAVDYKKEIRYDYKFGLKKWRTPYSETIFHEEGETVGLTGNNRFTENKLRKEQGIDKRLRYKTEDH